MSTGSIDTKHYTKFSANKNLISELQKMSNPSNDWITTIAFYSALHLVDGKIVKSLGETSKPMDHVSRNKLVGTFSKIRKEYQALYMLSRKARYVCGTLNDAQKQESLNYLSHIEKNV